MINKKLSSPYQRRERCSRGATLLPKRWALNRILHIRILGNEGRLRLPYSPVSDIYTDIGKRISVRSSEMIFSRFFCPACTLPGSLTLPPAYSFSLSLYPALQVFIGFGDYPTSHNLRQILVVWLFL